jgi:hypothetical protein
MGNRGLSRTSVVAVEVIAVVAAVPVVVVAAAEVVVIMIILFNSLLFMCQVNSHKANYRHSTV